MEAAQWQQQLGGSAVAAAAWGQQLGGSALAAAWWQLRQYDSGGSGGGITNPNMADIKQND